ncbi:hypothetical protein MHYP_G00291920 [Metynnis hypsauchen]
MRQTCHLALCYGSLLSVPWITVINIHPGDNCPIVTPHTAADLDEQTVPYFVSFPALTKWSLRFLLTRNAPFLPKAACQTRCLVAKHHPEAASVFIFSLGCEVDLSQAD